jgi:hypothetical protein
MKLKHLFNDLPAFRATILLILLLSITSHLFAQTLPVGLLENVEDAYRRQQLLGTDKSKSSYMIRPIVLSDAQDLSLGDSKEQYSLSNFRKLIYSDKKLKAEVYLLPVVVQQQFNSNRPYGMNDGSMVQARGYQIQTSAGVYAKVGPLSVQFRPEYVYANNRDFQELSEAPNGVFWNTSIANRYNTIDLPDRFGENDYSKLTWGQSSIRLNAGPASFGFSSENLWWGPGVRSSLLMSNNATGFNHFTLNTTRPVETPVGSFEAQVIAGRLNQSGIATPIGPEYRPRPKGWRNLTGFVITYQPKWVPNLYFGFDRTSIVNHKDEVTTIDSARRDPYFSFFTRYVLPDDNAEFYFEFGRNDRAYNLRDALVEPEHTRAYVVGFRKLIPLNRSEEYIQLGIELTQLEKSKTRDLRASESWYNNAQVRDGYTNLGQVIGAGIGPGSDLQSLDVSWVKGLKRIGLQFERLVNNNDLFYNFAYASLDKNEYINRHWIDLSVAGKFAWNYKQFVLNSQLTYIRSLNYEYQWEQGSDYWQWKKKDLNNMQFKIGIMYMW